MNIHSIIFFFTAIFCFASECVAQDSLYVRRVGFYNTPGLAYGVAVSGNYAYVADLDLGLRVVDITNPAAPSAVGFYNTPGDAMGVAVQGNYAYVADYDQGLRVVNITNPAAPFEAGFYDTPGDAHGVAVSGNYAYMADEGGGLRVVNITNPSSPVSAGFYNTPGYAYGVAVSGNYAYVADGGLRVVDITNPASPMESGHYDTPGSAYGVAVSGNYAYVADYYQGLRVIDITNPAAPTEAGFYNTPGDARGVAVAGNYAYVADHDRGLGIYDCSRAVSTPLPVSNLQGILSGNDVTLTWTDPDHDTDGRTMEIENVQIWLGLAGSGTLLGTIAPNVQTFVHLLAPNGLVTYNVRAAYGRNYSLPATFSIQHNIELLDFSPVAPSSFSTDVPVYPRFEWTSATLPTYEDLVDYYLIIGTDPTFGPGSYEEYGPYSDLVGYPPVDLLVTTTYFWKIRAHTVADSTRESSSPLGYWVLTTVAVTNNQPQLTGTQTMNRTLRPENNPYKMVSSVVTSPSTTFKIRAGSQVKVQGNFGFTINGTLIFDGTEEDSVSVLPVSGNWEGMNFTASSPVLQVDANHQWVSGNRMSYFRTWNSGAITGSSVYLNNSTFQNCTGGISSGASSHFLLNEFRNNSSWGAGSGDYFYGNVCSDNSGYGLLASSTATLDSNFVTGNTQYGIQGGDTLVQNVVMYNQYYGIYCSSSALLTDNFVTNNTQYGIYCSWSANLTDNVIRTNGQYGIQGGDTLVQNEVRNNQQYGINCSSHAFLADNVVYHNSTYGVQGGTSFQRNVIRRNHASGVSSCNVAAYFSYNVVDSNGGVGIGDGATFEFNTVSKNEGSGISVVGEATIRDNIISFNGGDAISTYSSGCTIDRNVIIGNAGRVVANCRNLRYNTIRNNRTFTTVSPTSSMVGVTGYGCQVIGNIISGHANGGISGCSGALLSLVGNNARVDSNVIDSAYFTGSNVNGLVFLNGSNLRVMDNTIDSTLAYNGGGMYVSSNSFQVLRNRITNARATQDGGAFYFISDNDTVGEVFSDNTVSNCTAQRYSGAVRVADGSRIPIIHNILTANNALVGSAIYGDAAVAQNVITSNGRVGTDPQASAVYGNPLAFTQNNLYFNTGFDLRYTSASPASFTYNWWGSRSDQGQIDPRIYDDQESNNAIGVVTYQPILTSPSSQTPGQLSIIDFVRVTSDSVSTVPFVARVPLGTSVSCLIQGVDGNPFSIDITELNVVNLRTHFPLLPLLWETGFNTGQFRSTVRIASTYDPNNNQMGAQNGDTIRFRSTVDTTKQFDIVVGHDLPVAFSLLSPDSGERVDSLMPLFDWTDSNTPYADSLLYTLAIAQTSDFLSADSIGGITQSQHQLTPSDSISLAEGTTYFWKVSARDMYSGVTWCTDGYWPFQVGIPDPPLPFSRVLPLNGSTVETGQAMLLWTTAHDSDPGDSVSYTVQWSTRADFQNYASATTNDTSFLIADLSTVILTRLASMQTMRSSMRGFRGRSPLDDLPDDTTIYWRVKATDRFGLVTWANGDTVGWMFHVGIPDSPGPFSLLAPVENTTIYSYPVQLTWQQTSDPDPGEVVHYDVYLDTLANLTTAALIADSIAGISFNITGGLLDDHVYYWTVRATDANTAGTWASDTLMFRTSFPQPPTVFSLMTPTNGSVISVPMIELSWRSSRDPDPENVPHYDVRVDTLRNLGTSWLAADSIVDTTFVLQNPIDDHQYYWTVRATDNNTAGTWASDSLMFMTGYRPDPPRDFNLSSPADSTVVRAYPVALSWQSSADPDYDDTVHYDLYVDTLATLATKWLVADSIQNTWFSIPGGLMEDHLYHWTVRATDSNTPGTWANDTLCFFVDMETAANDPASLIPDDYYFSQNFPNPFNPSTHFEFGLPKTSPVKIVVFDLLGREIGKLVDDVLPAGRHQIIWDCRTCPSGLYLAVMSAGGNNIVRKVTLLK